MFTIGIFTTHIPYIAFVVFYVFFLVFGVNKSSSGDIQPDKKYFSFEITKGSVSADKVSENPSDYHYSGPGVFSPRSNENSDVFVSIGNLQHQSHYILKKWHCNIYPAQFSRPPPAVHFL